MYDVGRRVPRVPLRMPVLPKSIGPDDTVLSSMRELPRDVRLAEGDPEGDAGDSVIKGRLLPGAGAGGGIGDSQKNEPNPGEPEKELAPENEGDRLVVALRAGCAGESMSMLLSPDTLDLGDTA